MDLGSLSQDIWSSDEVSLLSSDEQFRWICQWLTEKKLFGALDRLMEEYDMENSAIKKLVCTLTNSSSLHQEVIKPADPISHLNFSHEKVHTKSVLALACHPTKPWLFTSDTEKRLVVSNSGRRLHTEFVSPFLETGQVLSGCRSNNPFLGSVIAIDCHPTLDLILIGTMDDRHAVLSIQEINENEVLRVPKPLLTSLRSMSQLYNSGIHTKNM